MNQFRFGSARWQRRTTLLFASAALSLSAAMFIQPSPTWAEYPKPSVYPISWELKFEHDAPKRIVLDVPGQTTTQAYWYMTYTVTNNTDKELNFLPIFEMLTRTGDVVRSDKDIPAKVFDTIKQREKKQFLQGYPQVAGQLRIGEDQSRDGVAIWLEPTVQMGQFTIFVGGLSGEIQELKDDKGVPMKDPDGSPTILRKTLELTYISSGQNAIANNMPAAEVSHDWVMR